MAKPGSGSGSGSASGPYKFTGSKGNDVLDGRTLPAEIQLRGLVIDGLDGDDMLIGGSGRDTLNGGGGNDTLVASLTDLQGVAAGTVVYDGGTGSDTLDLSGIPYAPGTGIWLQMSNGAKGSNFIRTDVSFVPGNVFGDPVTYGGSSYNNNFKSIENFILGDGDDFVQLLTPSGNNIIDGRGGNDFIRAGDGNDIIFGGDGDDLIDGGWGDDILYGGSGSDVFTITGRLSGQYTRDVIKDFDIDGSDGTLDQLWLWDDWRVEWDPNSPDQLRGRLYDGATLFGEITLENLTYADASSVLVQQIDPGTGFPL